MMQRLTGVERWAVGLWVVIALLVGNAIYDLLVSRAMKEYLFRRALSEAGRAPAVSLSVLMDVTVSEAAWVGLLWGSVVLLAGMLTIVMMRRVSTPRSDPPQRSPLAPAAGSSVR